MVEIAAHQVGAAQIYLISSGIAEVEHAAMLKESPDDAGHSNVIAYAPNTGTQAADAAHQQIDSHSRLRRPIQQPDHFRVFQGVHLKNQARFLAAQGKVDLAPDQLLQLLPQV